MKKTPKCPQKRNKFRKAMKDKGRNTIKKLSKMSLSASRNKQMVEYKKKLELQLKNSLWAA